MCREGYGRGYGETTEGHPGKLRGFRGDLVLTEGRLPPRVWGLVVEWAARHRAELSQNREAIENRRPLRKIEPLD